MTQQKWRGKQSVQIPPINVKAEKIFISTNNKGRRMMCVKLSVTKEGSCVKYEILLREGGTIVINTSLDIPRLI